MKHSEMFKHIQFSVDSYSKRISSKITRLNSYDHQHYHHHHHCKKNTILKRTYSEPIINLKIKKNRTHSFSFKNVLKFFFSYNIILIFLTFFYQKEPVLRKHTKGSIHHGSIQINKCNCNQLQNTNCCNKTSNNHSNLPNSKFIIIFFVVVVVVNLQNTTTFQSY